MAAGPYVEALVRSGATVNPASGRPLSYGDPAAELTASLAGAVVADRSDFARILSTGADLLDLLHRLSTQDLKGLPPGRGRSTVLTTAKGRMVERLFVFPLEPRKVLLLGGRGAGTAEGILSHLARYTFAEDTGLSDVTGSTRQIVLCGPAARAAASAAGLPAPAPLECLQEAVGPDAVTVLGTDGDGGPGISFVVPLESAARVWLALQRRLEPSGVRPAGDSAMEARRVSLGLPASGFELTEEHNPLEAGLWDAVSFTKGCYVGQEVVARLRTYDKVSKRLVGLAFDEGSPVPTPGTRLFHEGREVGVVTTAIQPPGGSRPAALAYVKRDVATAQGAIRVGAADSATTAAVRVLAEPARDADAAGR